MRTLCCRHVVAGGMLVALLAAATQAENRLEVQTTARDGGTAITAVVADGDNHLLVQNQATRGGTSRLAVDASARHGGTIRGRIFAGSRDGKHDGSLWLRADGPGGAIDVQDVSVANEGAIYHHKRLRVEGNSELISRSQQFAERGGTATSQQDIALTGRPGGRNRLDVDVVTDGIGHDATNRLRLRLDAGAGGSNQHRFTAGTVAHHGPATTVADVEHRTSGGVNRSTIGLFDSR